MQSLQDQHFLKLLKKISDEGINTTIIGIGLDFNSDLAEICANNRGTNYFSATNDEHLEKIIIKEFEYNFFPVAYDVELEFKSSNFKLKKCIGVTDHKIKEKENTSEWKTSEHHKQDNLFKTQVKTLLLTMKRYKKKLPMACLANYCDYIRYNKKSICNINTIYSSTILENINGELLMQGGLILLKLTLEKCLFEMNQTAMIGLKYIDITGKKYSADFPVKLCVSSDIGSNPVLKTGLDLYYYAKFSRRIMKIKNNEYGDKKPYDENYLKEINLQIVKDKLMNFIKSSSDVEEMRKKILGNIDKIYDLGVEKTKDITK